MYERYKRSLQADARGVLVQLRASSAPPSQELAAEKNAFRATRHKRWFNASRQTQPTR